ncbi:hypothetical protein EYS14_14785 [Alteromonadaceae bacterium M269]|nr:hypothetical protein EYS14_14785 [Alteromonadaceae bacterium M269]
MSNKPTSANDGYQPKVDVTKGYQPTKPSPSGTSESGSVQGGYQPTTNEGGGPTSSPPPSKK